MPAAARGTRASGIAKSCIPIPFSCRICWAAFAGRRASQNRQLVFRKILIANRGEIALRIMRTLREMNIRSVAVYSDADRGSPHVRAADEAYPIGPAPARESYLSADKLLGAAHESKAEAIIP